MNATAISYGIIVAQNMKDNFMWKFGFCFVLGISFVLTTSLPRAQEPTDTRIQKTPYQVAHNRVEFESLVADGGTPLDAFTAYGKREFIRDLRWGDRGLGGFGFGSALRELTSDQILALFRFIGAEKYLPQTLPNTTPLRFPEADAAFEHRFLIFKELRELESQKKDAALENMTIHRSRVAEDMYQREFAARLTVEALKSANEGDLLLLFQMATVLAVEEMSSNALADQQHVYAELQNRSVNTRRYFDEILLESLLALREYKQAGDFVALRSDLAAIKLPNIVDKLGATFTGQSVLAQDGDRWIRKSVPLTRGIKVIVVAGSGCHFSDDALQALITDPDLQTELKKVTLQLLTSARDTHPFEFVRAWNKKHPATSMQIPFHRKEWPTIDVAGTPIFFFLVDDKVREVIMGWNKEKSKGALILALRKYGM